MQNASNNLIKELKKQKREGDLLFLDNIKIIKDVISSLQVKCLLVRDKELLSKISPSKEIEEKTYLVDSKTIEMLTDSKTPQGVVCIAYYLQNVVQKPSGNFLVLDGLQDPGNVGTLIRTALACGFEQVYLIDSVKVTNSKLVRSSAGAIFNIKVFSCTKQEFISLAKEQKLNLFKADMNGENIFELDGNLSDVGVVIGNEGQGVSKEISNLCKRAVKIPMHKGIESLNASISGAIIMYQIAYKSKKL